VSTGETTIVIEERQRPSRDGLGMSTIGASPADVLWTAEVARTRAFIRLTMVSILGMLATLPLFSGDPTIEITMAVALVIGLLAAGGFYISIRDPRRYTHRAMTLLCLSGVVNAQIVVVYFGVFSAGVLLLVLGIYFFGRAESDTAPLLVYAATACGQALCAALFIGGVFEDPGLFRLPELSKYELVAAQVLIQAMLLAAFWTGRSTRATTAEAMEDLQRAMQVAAQRGALLHEARAELDRALQVGEPGPFTNRVLGQYSLGVVIGRGAMGDVYAATHTETAASAAVKLLPTSVLGDPRYVERFMREARAASALESPHVVRILNASDPSDPLPYLVMERLEGHDLAQQLRRDPRLDLEEVCELARQLGSVIDLARIKGIVHRDMKPQNVYLAEQGDSDPMWKLLDFGVAALADQSEGLTQGHAVGTPAYMSPEQARSESVDHRADLYGLAAIVYRCITGRPAFAARDVPALLYDVVHKMPERPGALAGTPEDIDAVLAIGLAKRRSDRFEAGHELADALHAAADGRLAPALRERGKALVANFPWGTRR
jgi:serine/threonine-protein kinase